METEQLKKMFLKVYSKLMESRDDVIDDCKMIMDTLIDFEKLELEMNEQSQEIEVVSNLVKSIVKENSSTAKSQEEYLKKYEALQNRYDIAVAKMEGIKKEYLSKKTTIKCNRFNH